MDNPTARGLLFGRSHARIEDRPLVTGRGKYLDDIQPQGCLAAAFVRSPHAHARIVSVDDEQAKQLPGVVAVYTLEELKPHLKKIYLETGLPSKSIKLQVDRPLLALDEVVYVGEPIAVVIADSRANAEDAADALLIEFEPLEVVGDCLQALASDAPQAHSKCPHNCVAEMNFSYGAIEEAFNEAKHVVTASYAIHRGGSHSMEGRGVLAVPDALSDGLNVWSSTQTPQALKRTLAEMLGREETSITVAVPDVGGGFGPKLVTYPEEVVIALVATLTGKPVKWIEDRREHFVSTTQERDQHWDMEMSLDAEGKILGVRGKLLHDHGAYTARGLNVPYQSGVNLPLTYNIPAYALDISVVLTNKVPVTPIRGAGAPQATFVMERLMDRASRQLGMDPHEIRLKNLVTPEQMPCTKPLKLRGGTNIILDSGDFPATQRDALKLADFSGFATRKRIARAAGRRIGIGLANYVEGTGRGPYESVDVSISRSGKIVIKSGAAAMGQGTATMLAQIVGEQLGGDLSNILVQTGNPNFAPGFGGFNSRQTVIAGASAHKAATIVRKKSLQVAASILNAAPDELDIVGNGVVRRGANEPGVSFAELAKAAAGLPGFPLPGDIESPGLQSLQQVVINDLAFSNGCAIAEVEVDEETGRVRVLDVSLSHDCGRMVNPMTVDGQVVGGIAHGIGNSLFEKMGFDTEAQPTTTTLADYLLVTASEMPNINLSHRESPSPLNELGVKGVGESGVIPMTAAIASAIDDALSDLGIHVSSMPISPQELKILIDGARNGH